MAQISAYIIPLFIGIVIIAGLVKKVPVFDEFLIGAKDGFSSAINIIPAMVALVTAVSVLRSSGVLDAIASFLSPYLLKVGFPSEVLPLAFMRPISGSGALAVLDDILKNHSPDSFVGRVASVMMGSTETTFYTIAIYYGSVGIKRIGQTVPAALSADITGFITSAFFVTLFM